jgi:hypothetical protein
MDVNRDINQYEKYKNTYVDVVFYEKILKNTLLVYLCIFFLLRFLL